MDARWLLGGAGPLFYSTGVCLDERASLGRLLCRAGKSGQSVFGHTFYPYLRVLLYVLCAFVILNKDYLLTYLFNCWFSSTDKPQDGDNEHHQPDRSHAWRQRRLHRLHTLRSIPRQVLAAQSNCITC